MRGQSKLEFVLHPPLQLSQRFTSAGWYSAQEFSVEVGGRRTHSRAWGPSASRMQVPACGGVSISFRRSMRPRSGDQPAEQRNTFQRQLQALRHCRYVGNIGIWAARRSNISFISTQQGCACMRWKGTTLVRNSLGTLGLGTAPHPDHQFAVLERRGAVTLEIMHRCSSDPTFGLARHVFLHGARQ